MLPPFARSPRAFSCRLHDDWDVATLLRLVSGARWHPDLDSFHDACNPDEDEPEPAPRVRPLATRAATRAGRRSATGSVSRTKGSTRGFQLNANQVKALRAAQAGIRRGKFATEEEVVALLDEATALELVEALSEADRRELVPEEEFWKQAKSRARP